MSVPLVSSLCFVGKFDESLQGDLDEVSFGGVGGEIGDEGLE